MPNSHVHDETLETDENPVFDATSAPVADRSSATPDEAIAALTSVQRAAPADDWSATRTDNPPKGGASAPPKAPKAGSKRPDPSRHDDALQILLTPNIPRPTKRLGGTYHQGYELRQSRGASKEPVRWLHSIDGKYEGSAGTSTSVGAKIMKWGETPIRTTVAITRPDGSMRQEDAPLVTVISPRAATDILSLWSRLPGRDDLPVRDHFHPDEDLVVVVRMPYVDEVVEHAHAEFYGNLTVKDVSYRGARGTFEVVMKSQGKGSTSGSLIVAPKDVDFLHSRATALPSLAIINKSPASQEYGNRPTDADDAVSRIPRRVHELYERRKDGLTTLMAMLTYKDPPPADPGWKRGLKALGRMAIDAAAAAVGERVKSALSASDHAKEAAKVLIESLTAAFVNESIDQAFKTEDAKQAARRSKGVLLRIPEFFVEVQNAALSKLKIEHGDVATTHAKALVQRLERARKGSGYLAALDLADQLDAERESASRDQYDSSLQAWCAMLAQLRLGTVGDNGQHGTQMMTQARVSKIVDDPETPLVQEKGSLDATRGVVRMELGLHGANTLRVVRSFITGFDNDDVIDSLARVPIKDLKVPMVARFNASKDDAFVIARNEAGSITVDSQGPSIFRWAPRASSKEGKEAGPSAQMNAAESIFEKQIGLAYVRPRRG